MTSTSGFSLGTSLVRKLGDGVGWLRPRLPVRPQYRTGRHGDHHGGERRLGARAGSRYAVAEQGCRWSTAGPSRHGRCPGPSRYLRARQLLAAALARRGDLRPRLDRSAGRTEFGVGLGPSVAARTRATGPGTERHTGTTWPEVERAADSTLIDRESGTVGTDIEATAESRLTADPNSARSDLESSAIFAGTDSDYGGTDRRLIRVVAWIVCRYSCRGQCQVRQVRNRLTRSRRLSADLQQPSRRMRVNARPAAPRSPLFPRKQLLHRQLSMCDSRILRVNFTVALLKLLAIDTIRRIRHLLLCARQSCRYSVSCRRGVP